MPLLNLYASSTPLEEPTLSQALASFSKLIAGELGKPERYVMVALAPCMNMSFAGNRQPACYAELKNVGLLPHEKVEHLSSVLCDAIANALVVPRDRIYIEFTNADGALWGFDGGTFG
jgi:phenylpyruvate tautomerase